LNEYLDNFDTERGVDRSREFDARTHAFYFDWFINNAANLFSAYSILNNESSKSMYLYLIAFRLGGHLSVKLPVQFINKKNEFAEYKSIEKYTKSQLLTNGMFGNLRHYDFEYKNNRYIVDCLALDYYLFRGQYFYSKDGVDISPELGDTVIDGGACTGDTAIVFSNAVGSNGHVYAFDPVADHLKILEHNIKQFPNKNVKVMPFGLGNKNIIANPISLGQYAPGFSSDGQLVPLCSIDNLVNAKEIQKIDFIKLDIEGAEMDALQGARESIERFKPKLAISLYHKPNDLFEIILHIKNNFPFYSCYLDHYTIHTEETVLYCK
jgi:FkbM family methyltransferase